MPRSKFFTTLFVALIVGAGLWYMWMITSAKLEWGGASPGQQQLGAVADTRHRAASQYCTGVVATPQGTWLVARLNRDAGQVEASADVVDLDALVRGKSNDEPEPVGSGAFAYLLSGREKETSFISRLDAQGQFQLVAHVSAAACLVASPDGASVLLLTGLDRPEAGSGDSVGQTVVFRSDDQGKRWTWLEQGWFPKADQVAWNLKPYFHGTDEVWAWGTPSGVDNESGEDVPGAISTGVYYSADRGDHSTPVMAAESLLVTSEYVRVKRPDVLQWHTDAGTYGDIRTHVIQLDPQRAFIWVSQRFWGSNPDGEGAHIAFNVTTRARLQRSTGQWQVVDTQRDDKLFIAALAQNADGRVAGLVDQEESGRHVIAELDTATLAWRPLGELPSVFAPLASQSRLREGHFYLGQNSLLVNVTSEHRPPRWLYWWSDASICADGVFYSRDWGRSWQRLAIGGYLGILGFQPTQDRVIWAKGNWYDNNDQGIYSYSLAQD
ncbi:hypothetical protein G7W60_08935 [Pseudomonas fluorescens]|uniref:hypothetical protein n=1 Tax=Pseudomonas TaxID=286 RepID=UPI001404AA3B|nr:MULTISPECIES: hypothetical protein [Pseudomonas]MDT8905842.1 hypothetical protein [Pseudomonas prosekii]NHN67960.1 hypothetical protein [Pseudomonas fluorescens]